MLAGRCGGPANDFLRCHSPAVQLTRLTGPLPTAPVQCPSLDAVPFVLHAQIDTPLALGSRNGHLWPDQIWKRASAHEITWPHFVTHTASEADA